MAGIDVNLPALRERRDHIPGLAALLLKRLAGGRPPCRLDPAALSMLQAYDFPGNVRELRNLLQRAVLTWLCQSWNAHARSTGRLLDRAARYAPL